MFSVGTIKNEIISWEQLSSHVGKNNDMRMEIMQCTIRNSYTSSVKARSKQQRW